MIPVQVEGVRRNFTLSSAFMYSVALVDADQRRAFTFGVERHEALALVAALHELALPRPQAIHLTVDALTLLGATLEELRIEDFSLPPPHYNLCSCVLRWRAGEVVREQTLRASPGDALTLALLLSAPILMAEALAARIGIPLAEGETPELLFARQVLRQTGRNVPTDRPLRLGYSKTPLRDALVKEFTAALQGKAPPYPEDKADVAHRKREYVFFLLGLEP